MIVSLPWGEASPPESLVSTAWPPPNTVLLGIAMQSAIRYVDFLPCIPSRLFSGMTRSIPPPTWLVLATCPVCSDIRPATVFGNSIPALRMGSYLPVSLSANPLVAEPVITRSSDNNGLSLDWLTQHLFPDPPHTPSSIYPPPTHSSPWW